MTLRDPAPVHRHEKDTQSQTNGSFDNFVLTTVPEPSGAARLGLEALGLFARRKR